MGYNKDWNAAFIGSEDSKAVFSSEVFRNFVKIYESNVQEELPPVDTSKMFVTADEALAAIVKEASAPNPIRSNLDYGAAQEVEDEDEDLSLEEMNIKASHDNAFVEMQIKQAWDKHFALEDAEEELGLEKNAFYMAKNRK